MREGEAGREAKEMEGRRNEGEKRRKEREGDRGKQKPGILDTCWLK